MKSAFLIGRLILGGFFAYNGVNHFRNRATMAQYAASKGVPAPDIAVTVSGAMLLVGAASIMLGLKPKIGGAAVIAFLAGVTPVMHNFWTQQDPGQRMSEMPNFMKNVALLGAALSLSAVDEPWPASVTGPQSTALARA